MYVHLFVTRPLKKNLSKYTQIHHCLSSPNRKGILFPFQYCIEKAISSNQWSIFAARFLSTLNRLKLENENCWWKMRNISIVMHNLYLLLLFEALLMSGINSIFQLFIYNVNIYKLEAMNQAVVIALSLTSDYFQWCFVLGMKQRWGLYSTSLPVNLPNLSLRCSTHFSNGKRSNSPYSSGSCNNCCNVNIALGGTVPMSTYSLAIWDHTKRWAAISLKHVYSF